MSQNQSSVHNEILTTPNQETQNANPKSKSAKNKDSNPDQTPKVNSVNEQQVNSKDELASTKKVEKKKKKKKTKVPRMLGRRRRAGEDESEDDSQDGTQSDSSQSESSASDDDQDEEKDESDESEDEGEDAQSHVQSEEEEEDESTETKVEVNGVSSNPKALSHSALTEPTTVSDSLADLSISKDWAQEAQEADDVKSSTLPKPSSSSNPATTSQQQQPSIPNSKKSKSQKRKDAKARKLAALEAEAKSNHQSLAQLPSNSNSNLVRRGGALPTGPSRGGFNGNGAGFAEPSSFRGGRGGFNSVRGGGSGGFSHNPISRQSQSNGVKGSGNPRSRMMSWSDDEEDEDGNPLVVDEDALEGKVVKTLPRELRIPTAPRALREKQKLFPNNHSRKEKDANDQQTSISQTIANGLKESKSNGSESSSRMQSSSPIPTGPASQQRSQISSNSTIPSETPAGKWDHDAFESLAANGRLDRRGIARRGGRGGLQNGTLDSRAPPITSGNGQVPPSGPRSMSRNRSPLNQDSSNSTFTSAQSSQAAIGDPREKAQELVASLENGQAKVKVPSPGSSSAQIQTQGQTSEGIHSSSQVKEQPKLPSFPPSSSQRVQQQQPTHPTLASLPPGFAMDATGVVFDLRSGSSVAVGLMDDGKSESDLQPNDRQQPPHHLQPRQQQSQPENKHLSISRQGHSRTPSSIPSSAVKAAAFYPGSNAGSSNAGSEGRKTPAQREAKSSNEESDKGSTQQTRFYTSSHNSKQPAFNHSPSNSQSQSQSHPSMMINPYAAPPHFNPHSPYYDYSALPPSPYEQQAMYHQQQIQAQFAYQAATGTPPPVATPVLYGTPPPTSFNPYAHHPQDPYFANPQYGGYYNPQ